MRLWKCVKLGAEIAKQKQVKPTTDGWLVKSQSGQGFWHVKEDFSGNCPDAETRKTTCKHCFAVRYFIQAEKPTGEVVAKMRIPSPSLESLHCCAECRGLSCLTSCLGT